MAAEHTIPDTQPASLRLDGKAAFALLLVCGLALFLRLHRLDAESLWMDEVRQVSYYNLPLQYLVIEGCGQGQPPMDYLIGGALDRLGLANSDWWVRFPAMLFGVGGVLLLGVLVSRMAGAMTGILAALLLAVCPLHVEMSQEARPYTIFFFFALAAILAYQWARRRHTPAAWVVFGATCLCMLMTRTIAPHVVAMGLGVFAVASWLWTRRSTTDEIARRAESQRLWAGITSMAIAYACVNPILGILYMRMQGFVDTPQTATWPAQVSTMIASSAQGLVGVHSSYANALASAPPTAHAILAAGQSVLLVAAAIGVLALLWRAWRRRQHQTTLFIATLLLFPIVYAVLYTKATTFPAKPQYLLLMAAPLFACAAMGVDVLHAWLARRNRTIATTISIALVLAMCVPLGFTSIQALYSQDKPDWRGTFTFLREHAAPDDAVAAVFPHWSVASKGKGLIGIKRYFREDADLLQIDLNTPLETFKRSPWTQLGNTVWVVCWKAPKGEVFLPAPLRPGKGIRVHDFDSLFVLEISGDASAEDRLMRGLAFLNAESEDAQGLAALNVLLLKHHLAQGDLAEARASLAMAYHHCRTETERAELAAFIPELGNLHITQGPPVD